MQKYLQALDDGQSNTAGTPSHCGNSFQRHALLNGTASIFSFRNRRIFFLQQPSFAKETQHGSSRGELESTAPASRPSAPSHFGIPGFPRRRVTFLSTSLYGHARVAPHIMGAT